MKCEGVFVSVLLFLVCCDAALVVTRDKDETRADFGVNGNCTFDENFCAWMNAKSGDAFDWTRTKGSTPSSNTGPQSDASNVGSYVYIESSFPRRKGEIASLIAGPFLGVLCMQFAYHMHGSHVGDLRIYMSERGPIGQTFVWGRYGKQGREWKRDNVTVYGFAFDVMIMARVGGGYEGDIALDEISFVDGTCYPDENEEDLLKRRLGGEEDKNSTDVKGSCNFDTGNCGWSNGQLDDIFDWSSTTGSTPTTGTGPSKDHGGKKGGKYMFIEASSPRRSRDKARLLSPQLCGQMCMRFYYHMFGSGIGSLNVLRKEGINGKDDRLWYAEGNKGKKWHRAIIPTNSDQDCYQVIFEGVVGRSFASDIAIDDIYIQKGSCCEMKSELNTIKKTGNCGFSKDLCGWKNLKIDDFDWTLGKGKTISDHTGPSKGYGKTDGYVFIESSEPRFVGDTAIMTSGVMLGAMCMRFRYHMYGEEIGSLSVFRNGDGVMQQLLWQQDGNQGNTWHEAQFLIDCNVTAYQVEIEATVGGWRGDIAIDELEFTPGACPPKDIIVLKYNYTDNTPAPPTNILNFEGFCFFANGFCSWENDLDDYCDWTRLKGPTATLGTGPDRDFSGDGYYIYLEASNTKPGEFARLLSRSIADTVCLRFQYFMHGKGVGDLRVEMRESENYLWNTTWTVSGDQKKTWISAAVTLTGYDYVIGVTAVRGKSFLGDIAVDNINLLPGSCLGDQSVVNGFHVGAAQNSKLRNCTFDAKTTCSWEHGDDEKSSKQYFEWKLRSGKTPTEYTGPSEDHTPKVRGKVRGKGYYMYFESSTPRKEKDKARMYLEATGYLCMRFFYHMYGKDMGTLNIIQKEKTSEAAETKIWSKKGDQGNKWNEVFVNINSTLPPGYKLIIEGIRGKSYLSDIAIDDITFQFGICSGSLD